MQKIIDRNIWANLIVDSRRARICLNQRSFRQKLLLRIYQQQANESFEDFLIRFKKDSFKQFSVELNSCFLAYHGNQKPQQLIANLEANNLKVRGEFEVNNSLQSLFLNSKKTPKLKFLDSTSKQLLLRDRLGAERVRSFSWKEFLRESLIASPLSFEELDLYLRFGFDLSEKEITLELPSASPENPANKLKELLIKKLRGFEISKLECLVVTGFLTSFKGIGEFLKRHFNLKEVVLVKEGEEGIILKNQALNNLIESLGLLDGATINTQEYIIRLKRGPRMLEWFYSLLLKR